jgi:2-C-methyl-D-erythritol 4-phosphate cytidylyltransferase
LVLLLCAPPSRRSTPVLQLLLLLPSFHIVVHDGCRACAGGASLVRLACVREPAQVLGQALRDCLCGAAALRPSP